MVDLKCERRLKEQSAFIAVAYKMKIIPASLQVHEQIIVYALNAELSSERKIYFNNCMNISFHSCEAV